MVLRRGVGCVAVVLVALVGCGSATKLEDVGPLSGGPVTSSPTPSPSPVATPSTEARAALTAAVEALNYETASDMQPLSYDVVVARTHLGGSILDSFSNGISAAQQYGFEFRGTQPTPHVTLTSDRTAQNPPSVVLTNCQNVPNGYQQYVIATGQPIAEVTFGPPYPVTLTMTKSSQRQWVISNSSFDRTKTCTP